MTLLKALQKMTAYASAYNGRFPDNVQDSDLKAARTAIAKAEQDQLPVLSALSWTLRLLDDVESYAHTGIVTRMLNKDGIANWHAARKILAASGVTPDQFNFKVTP